MVSNQLPKRPSLPWTLGASMHDLPIAALLASSVNMMPGVER